MYATYFYPPIARWSYGLLFLCLLLTGAASHSRSVLDLDESKQPIALGDWGEYWIDNGTQRGPDEVDTSTAIDWLPTPERGIYPLTPGKTLWIRFTIPPAPDAERWVLEIPYPALDRASLYTKDRVGQFTEQRAGDLTAVNKWLTPYRHPLLAVAFNAEEPTRYLLRLENAQGFSAPLRFVNARHVVRAEQLVSLFLGVYFGLAALGLATGLIGLVWQRDRAYVYYGLLSALVGLTMAALTGVAGLHLWPNSPHWADRSLTILGTLALVSLTLLNAAVVSLSERSKHLNRLTWAMALAGLALAVSLGLTDSALRLKIFVPYLMLVIVLVLSINLWAWRHGDRFGGWLLLSAAPFAIAWAISIARYQEWMPQSIATEQGGLAGMALQLPVLLAVLVLRSQGQRENRRRMMGLDRIDPATGLINDQVFAERLLRMNARSARLKHNSAVLVINVINTEQIQRDFGRKIAGELPLLVASRLISTAREIDSAARLSDQRFGMLVEGPVGAEEAATLGPRIIARCLMPYPKLHIDCVAQVRVAYAMVPEDDSHPQPLIERLEALLANAPAESKVAVFRLGDTPPKPRRRMQRRAENF